MASRGDINVEEIQPILYDKWLKLNIVDTLDKTGSFTKLKSSDFFIEGKYPVVDQGDKFISGYVNDNDLLYKGELPVIIFGDHTRNVKLIDFPFAAGADGTKILKPLDFYNSKFYYYYFKSLRVPNLGYSRHFAILKELEFPLPLLAEQNRIVDKLDSLFAQLEIIKTSMTTIPVLLKNFKQQVLTQAVTGKLTKSWRVGKELEKTIDTTIGQLFDVKTGSTPKRGTSKYYDNATIPWLKSGQVKNEFIYKADEFITELAVKETNAKVYPIDTILVAMYGEGKTRGQVGLMKIEATSNQAIAALVNTKMDLVTKKYVYNFCLSQYNEIRAQAEGGNQPNLNLSKIKNWEIAIPSQKEQHEIVSRIESLFIKADAIEKQYEALKKKIDTLPLTILHKAFKGELVEQLDTDGDARELLQQIQELKNTGLKSKKK